MIVGYFERYDSELSCFLKSMLHLKPGFKVEFGLCKRKSNKAIKLYTCIARSRYLIATSCSFCKLKQFAIAHQALKKMLKLVFQQ